MAYQYRLDMHRVRFIALAAVTLLFASMLVQVVLHMLPGALTQPHPVDPAVLQRQLAITVYSTLCGALACWLTWRRNYRTTQYAVLALTLVMPFIYDDQAFYRGVPQGFWIPFLLALAVCELRWALLVFAACALGVLAAYSTVWREPQVILTSSIIFTLLVAGRLIQQDLVRTADAARRAAEDAERSLRESESRFRLLVEESPLAIQALAVNGHVLWVNRASVRLWGVTAEQLADYDIFRDRQLEQNGVLPLLQRVLAGERVELPVIEYEIGAAPSPASLPRRRIWVRSFAYPVHADSGELREIILVQEDVSERVRAESQIRDLAFFDSLTHLPNRRLLMDRLGQALIASARSREFGALLILDLDNFKTLNDSQGHDIGDQLLTEVARRLTGTMRHQDTVARLGGDEFVVILEGMGVTENTATERIEQLAEKVRSAIIEPYQLGSNGASYNYFGTTSIGVAMFHGRAESTDTLLKQADVALYQAKAAGRNVIRFFNAQMQAAIDSRTSMEVSLRAALENSEFELHYQPQYDLHGAMIGVEALLRWHSPVRGMVLPGEFIPLAEDTALILPIGKWVIETACAQLRAWDADPRTRNLPVSVNVSARQLLRTDFVEQVQQSLRHAGANPHLLKLELTESVVLEDLEGVIDKLRRLTALGVGFALDDFGTGYSSLSYLKRLPLRQLKIDQSFVRDIDVDPNDSAIVEAIIAMSRSLGLQAIAEGVETQSQKDFLQRHGCEAFQGFFFARPMALTDLDKLLHQ